MTSTRKLIQFAIISVLITTGKGLGLHGIRIVVMGVLGLAGLWMLHTLAQDFTKIYSTINPQGNGSPIRFFAKRSINATSNFYAHPRKYPQFVVAQNAKPVKEDQMDTQQTITEIDWEKILSRDPVGCARSFVCQLVATKDETMSRDERTILMLIRMSSQKDNWATREIQRALKYGQGVNSAPDECRRQYRFCPYSSKMMIVLLRLFSGLGTT